MSTLSETITRRRALLRSSGWWLSWIVASTIAYLVGFVLLYKVSESYYTAPEDFSSGYINLCFHLPVFIVATILGGLVIGRLQWLVLRRRIELKRSWFTRTVLAWFFAPSFVLRSPFGTDSLPRLILLFLIAGAIIGACQWSALRHAVKAAALWIPISALAWVLGLLTGAFFSDLPLPEAEIFMWAGPVIMIGMVTGLGLVGLLESAGRSWPNVAVLAGISTVLVFAVAFPLSRQVGQRSEILRSDYFVNDLAFSADGTRLAAIGSTEDWGREEGGLEVWETENWRKSANISIMDVWPHRMGLSPDGMLAITSGGQLWDIATGKVRWSGEHAYEVAFSPDGELVALAYSRYEGWWIDLRDADTGDKRLKISGQEQWEIERLAFSPDGRTLASGSYPNGAISLQTSESQVRVSDASTGEQLQKFPGFSRESSALVYSPDGQLLLSASAGVDGDTSLRMWDLNTGDAVKKLDLLRVKDLAISPDGNWIAVAHVGWTDLPYKSGYIYLYDLASGKLIRVLRGHTDQVISLQFSPDGRYLASGSHDKTVRLWELALKPPH